MKFLTIRSLFSLFSWMSWIVSLRRVLTWKGIWLQKKKKKKEISRIFTWVKRNAEGCGGEKRHILTFCAAPPLWRWLLVCSQKGWSNTWRQQWKLISNPADWQDIRLRLECDTDRDMGKKKKRWRQVRHDWMVPCLITCPSQSSW